MIKRRCNFAAALSIVVGNAFMHSVFAERMNPFPTAMKSGLPANESAAAISQRRCFVLLGKRLLPHSNPCTNEEISFIMRSAVTNPIIGSFAPKCNGLFQQYSQDNAIKIGGIHNENRILHPWLQGESI